MNKAFYHRQHKENNPLKHYVYVHYKKGTNIPFYVGKGSGYRAWSLNGRNPYWKRTVAKYGYDIDIVFDNLSDSEAYSLEKDVIQEFKYFCFKLTNLTDGGEGGLNPSTNTRRLMSIAKAGKKPHNIGKKQPSTSGVTNPSSDKNIYTFSNKDGREFTGNRYDFLEKFPEVSRKQLGKLFITKPNKTVMGWCVKEFQYKFYKEDTDPKFDFVEIATSRNITCSIKELSKISGIDTKYIKRILEQGRGRKTTFGWTTKEYYDNNKTPTQG